MGNFDFLSLFLLLTWENLSNFYSTLRMRPKNVNKKTQGKVLTYCGLRAELLDMGTNLKRWAEERAYPLTTVYQAASGDRAGIRATKIRKELLEYVAEKN